MATDFSLVKETNIKFTLGHPAVPANPGRPFIPAHYETSSYQVCGYSSNGLTTASLGKFVPITKNDSSGESHSVTSYGDPSYLSYVYVPPGATVVGGQPAAGYGSSSTNASGSMISPDFKQCQTVTVTHYVPAQSYIPPTPAQDAVPSTIETDFNFGWNAGARSKYIFTHDGRAAFTVPTSVIGAVVGLNAEDNDTGFMEIEHAWYLSHGVARIYENGTQVFYYGPYSDEDVFGIERFSGVVSYTINGDTVYTSGSLSLDTVFLDTSLYSGGDSVHFPAMLSVGQSHTSIIPISGVAYGHTVWNSSYSNNYIRPLYGYGGISASAVGNGANVAFEPLSSYSLGYNLQLGGIARNYMLPMEVYSRYAVGGGGSFAPMLGLGSNRIYGQAVTSLRPLTIFAQGGMPIPSYAIAYNPMLYLTGGAHGFTGTVGGGNNQFVPMDCLASEGPYGEAITAFLPMQGYSNAYEGNGEAGVWAFFVSANLIWSIKTIYVTVNTRVNVGSQFTSQDLLLANLLSSISVTNTSAADVTLDALIYTLLTTGFAVPLYDSMALQNSDVTTWVVNADTKATTVYEQFDFNSYCKLDDAYYGCKEDGIYLLGADSDAGSPIRASVNFGITSLGNNRLKVVPNCYVGLSVDGKLVLKVTANGQSYFYYMRNEPGVLAERRFDIGRGLKANYFEFELFNASGSDFDLTNVTFVPVASMRRI